MYYRPKLENPIQSWILDSTPWIRVSGSGFSITIVSQIPDSQRWFPDFKSQDSGFHKQNSLRIPDFTGKNLPHSGIRIPLYGASIKFGS